MSLTQVTRDPREAGSYYNASSDIATKINLIINPVLHVSDNTYIFILVKPFDNSLTVVFLLSVPLQTLNLLPVTMTSV